MAVRSSGKRVTLVEVLAGSRRPPWRSPATEARHCRRRGRLEVVEAAVVLVVYPPSSWCRRGVVSTTPRVSNRADDDYAMPPMIAER